ncbi:MAG: hypothetical protein CVU06_02725 [Bacteroidetes bacterium HGW-Bacteroidetes-22]|nr:MAG: hypothetical protein CVU06_02725 [Bacteroidetes bacterium HGW-Bacteroidetes-22]
MPLLVYKSSAGSGKTFTLVKEYLKIVLENPLSYRQVLAITFTNKATAEMKGRITQTLAGLANDSSDVRSMLKALKNDPEFNISPELIPVRAARVLQLILHGYSEFSVCTIDSFMHRVVRAFAFDLHLPVNFEVEIDTDSLIDRTVGELLNMVGSDQGITSLLTGFVKTLVDDEKGWDISTGIKSIAKTLFDERERTGAEPLRSLSPADFLRIHMALQQHTSQFEQKLKGFGRDFVDLLRDNGIEMTDTARGNAGFYNYMERLANGDFSKLSPNRHVQSALEDEKWESAKCSPSIRAALYTLSASISHKLNTTIGFIETNQQHYFTLKAVAGNFFPMATLSLLDILLIQVARNRNLVHLSEFNRRIATVVLNEPVPFVYARLGEKYRHFLIDEFQDTSIIQWQNILPLVHNTLSSPAEGHNPMVMIVGDSKQSIYRWRNGETAQFQQLPLIYSRPQTTWFIEAEQTLIRNYKPKDLGLNFRSTPEIIDFNCLLFKHAGALLSSGLKETYNNVEQTPGGSRKNGRVEIVFNNGKGEEGKGKSWDITMVKASIEKSRAEGFSFAQIAVLCRGNDDCASVARELLSEGIPVVSSESLLLSSSPRVSALVTAMRMLHQPENHVYKASLELLMQLIRKTDKLSLNNESDPVNEPNADHLLSLPFYDLAETLVRRLGLNNQHDLYLQFFLDAVQEFSRKDHRGLTGFLEWWDGQRSRRSVDLPDGADAVQVMTIHKAKGLAFDVVILPFISNRVRPGRSFDWIFDISVGESILPAARVKMETKSLETSFADQYNEEMDKTRLDTINLLYVAFTRAISRLYIFSAEPPAESDSPGPSYMLRTMLNAAWPESGQMNTFIYGAEAIEDSVRKFSTPDTFNESFSGVSFDWHEQITVGRPASVKSAMADISGSLEFGILVHNILSNIITPHDIPEQVKKAIIHGKLNQDMALRIERRITEIVNQPDITPFFNYQGEVKTEAPILLANGNLLRPDRVMINRDEALVIDFKTGKTSPVHEEQIINYASALSELGYKTVKGWLLYLSDPPHVKVVV